MKIKKGVALPLRWTCPTGDVTKVVRATVYDLAGNVVGTDTLTAQGALGLYAGSGTILMPGTAFAFAVFSIYQSGGITPSTDTALRFEQDFELDVTSHLDSVTAFLDSHASLPVRDSINMVRSEDATIPVTIILARDDFAPLDVSAATEIIGRFVKEDLTKLEKTMTGGFVAIVSGPAGQITVTLTAADTALLQISERQNMEVEVHVGGVVRIAQVIGKINVRDSILS